MKSGILFVFAIFITLTTARKHRLTINNDDRRYIDLNTFGFLKGGTLSVNLTNFHFTSHSGNKSSNGNYGFTLAKTSGSGISPINEVSDNNCLLSKDKLKGDTSISIVFFILDTESKCFRVDSKGKDVAKLRITYPLPELNTTSTPGKSKREAEDKQPPAPDIVVTTSKSTTTTSKSTTTTTASTTKSLVTTKAASGSLSTSNPSTSGQPGTTTDSFLSLGDNVGGVKYTEEVALKDGKLPIQVDPIKGISTYFVVSMDTDDEEGLYSIYFHNCNNYYGNDAKEKVNFTIHISERNGDNYLSAGSMPLPAFYFLLCIVYFVLAAMWFMVLKRATEGIFNTHYLMLSFLFVKALSLLFHAIDYHFIKVNGQHGETFAILYYITYLMKGTLLLVTILLIGAGWSFIKHILSKREKQLFVIIIPLQITANVAQVIIQETEEGDEDYTTWKTIFLMMDLLCCGAVLFPVVWSIRHLQDASQTDGKAAINLAKLKIFRHFYILIVIYIYTTRIIAYLLIISLPFQYEWFCQVFKEAANLVFFITTGVKFRPASDNPYLQIAQSDSEEEEMEEIVTSGGAMEGLTRVNIRDTDSLIPASTTPKQRESSHDFD